MRTEVTMPRMGQSMEEGTVLKWLKTIGDTVKRGEQLVEIETDKATVDIESFATGTLVEIIIEEGQTVNVGTVIAIIEDTTSMSTDIAEQPSASHTLSAVATQPDSPKMMKQPRVNASPLAKRLAVEHNIDLFAIQGTGPGGRIGKDDIRLWISTHQKPSQATLTTTALPIAVPNKNPIGGNKVVLSKMKLATARRMVESKTSAPHFYVSMDIEMSRALELQASLKARGYTVTINDLILKAVALALTQYPNLNSTFADNTVERQPDIHLAIAVAIGEKESEGLLTPIIPACQSLSLVEIAAASKQAVERAKAGKLNAGDLAGGTFTVSNLGMFGVKSFEAIVNTPQTAIVAVGAIRREPTFDAFDRVIPAQLMTVTVSADHRVTDGAEVARFLKTIKSYLEDAFILVSTN